MRFRLNELLGGTPPKDREMRTRPNDWLDTNTLETKYGIDVLHDGKWKHLAEDGKPCIYSTPAERDAKRAEYRKKSMPPN